MKILSMAEKLLETEQDRLELAGGKVFVRDHPDESITLQSLARRAPEGALRSRAESKPDPAEYDKSRLTSCFYPAFHHPSFHCHAAEVEVDPDTGMTRVLRYAAAHDIGRAINPTLIEGQIEGGVMQGIGMALMEEVLYDERGVRTNINWTDYKLRQSPTCRRSGRSSSNIRPTLDRTAARGSASHPYFTHRRRWPMRSARPPGSDSLAADHAREGRDGLRAGKTHEPARGKSREG